MNTPAFSSPFETIFKYLLLLEGDYSNDPDDNGGPTRFGISKNAHRDVNIEHLTQAEAKCIYWAEYWLVNRCDRLPAPIAMALFDGVVNHRALAARKIIQLALGVTADGVIGPITAAAAETSDPKPVLARYFAGRANLYHQIIIADSRKSKFARGWFKRLFKVQQFILDECWPYKL